MLPVPGLLPSTEVVSPPSVSKQLDRTYRLIYHLHGPKGVFARTWTTGAIAFWAVVGFLGFLLLYLWGR